MTEAEVVKPPVAALAPVVLAAVEVEVVKEGPRVTPALLGMAATQVLLGQAALQVLAAKGALEGRIVQAMTNGSKR